MRQALKAFVMTLASWALLLQGQEKAPLKLVVRTPLPGFTGDLDHFGLDVKGNRLFLAAEEHKTVEVFDLQTGARTHSILGFAHPLMMAYLPESNRLVVTDGDDNAVQLVDCAKYKIIKTTKLRPNVDHGVLNPISKFYYVESGGGSNSATHVLSILDTKSLRLVGEVRGLPGSSSEGMVIDRAGKRLYVNLTGSDEVGVVDLETRQLVAKWALPQAHEAHAIALDEPNHRLFTVSRKPAQFIVFDIDTGKAVATLPCVGVNSDMSFDVPRKRIYVTGSESASVFEQLDADHYKHIGEVPTAYRAKSSVFVQELKRLYVAVSGKGRPDATLELQVYEIQ